LICVADDYSDAADPTLPERVASKVTAADHSAKMEILYQQRDAELRDAWRAR
jgi:hypothetical protein